MTADSRACRTGSERYAYVIVGGGTAGCVVAARLVEARAGRVLLLEAGGGYRSFLDVPLAGMKFGRRYSWPWVTEPQQGLGGRRIALPLGRVLGGGSSINAMIYCRGGASSYERWRAEGLDGWGFEDLLPFYRRLERRDGGASALHGGDGPVAVSRPRHVAAFSESFLEGCLQAGLAANVDFNGEVQEGAGLFDVTQDAGRRVSAAAAYLGYHRSNPALTIRHETLVTRLIVEGGRAVGVEYVKGGRVSRAFAEAEVILSGGAVGSPHLLLLSGIGPAGDLERASIEVLVDLPGVGRNLHDHPRVPVLFKSDRVSPGARRHWIPATLTYLARRQGVLASNCCEAGAFLRSDSALDAPDLQIVTHFQSALAAGAVDIEICFHRPASRGRLSLRSADPQAAPLIDPAYLSHPADILPLVRGIEAVRRIASTPALRAFPLRGELLPGLHVRAPQDVERYLRSHVDTCYHPVGTCRMGTGSESVVDSQLRVRGLEALRVVDASVIPTIVNGNTAAPTYLIAEKGADLILGRTLT